MKQDEAQDWESEISRRVGAQIGALRLHRQKMSAQALADQTKQLGHPVSRNTIVDIELGRRRTLSVAQLCVLAEALDLAPLELLFPADADSVEYLPGVSDNSTAALDWFAGLGRERVQARRELARMTKDLDALVDASRKLRLRRVVEKASGGRGELPYARELATYGGVAHLEEEMLGLQRKIAELEAIVRADGG